GAIGGEAYVSSLIDGCLPESAKQYAAIIQTRAQQRRFLNALEIAKSKTIDGEAPEHVLAGIEEIFSDRISSGSLGHTYEEILNVSPISFAIEGFLQEQGITLIGGLSGHGKTLIMLAMVRALLEGGKLFHHFVVNKTAERVIYLIPEAGLGPVSARLKTFHLDENNLEWPPVVRT